MNMAVAQAVDRLQAAIAGAEPPVAGRPSWIEVDGDDVATVADAVREARPAGPGDPIVEAFTRGTGRRHEYHKGLKAVVGGHNGPIAVCVPHLQHVLDLLPRPASAASVPPATAPAATAAP